MNIIVVEFDSSGGLIHYAYQLCSAMAETDADITLITGTDYELENFPHNFTFEKRLDLWSRHEPPKGTEAKRTGLAKTRRKITRFFQRARRALKLINAWRGLTAYLIQLKPDIVQFSEIHFFFESFFLRRLRNHGMVLCQICHEFEHREEKGFLKPFMTRLNSSVFVNFSAIFFLSQHIRDSFLARYPFPLSNTHLIPHGNESIFLRNAASTTCGENLQKRYKLSSHEDVILFFGTLVPSKGILDLIEAFALLPQQYNAKLIIAGFPSKHVDVEYYKQHVAAYKLTQKVIFDLRYIPMESVGELMELATVVVFPYHSSTQSGAIQVAYTFSRPVIATAVGGLAEVVDDGKSGFLVPPKRPDMIADKILLMLESPKIAEKMGAYAGELAENRFSWKPIAERIFKVYCGLLPPEGVK